MESGKALNLLPETSRIFRLSNNPIESGSVSRRFEARLSSSRFTNPAIESGITYFPPAKVLRYKKKKKQKAKTEGHNSLILSHFFN